MKYDLTDTAQREAFAAKARALAAARAGIVELAERRPPRTGRQNRYFWATVGYVAALTGYTKAEVEDLCKRTVCPSIFRVAVRPLRVCAKGGRRDLRPAAWQRRAYRHTYELTTAEMGRAIDLMRDFFARELGIRLPSPDDGRALLLMEAEAERAAAPDA